MSRQKNEDCDIYINISYIYKIYNMISNEIQRVAVVAILCLSFHVRMIQYQLFLLKFKHNTSNHNSPSIIFVCQLCSRFDFDVYG